MTVKGSRMIDAGLAELLDSSLVVADRAMQSLSRIARDSDATACRLSAHSNKRNADFIPATRRNLSRILGGPLSLAQRHNAGRVSMRGGK